MAGPVVAAASTEESTSTGATATKTIIAAEATRVRDLVLSSIAMCLQGSDRQTVDPPLASLSTTERTEHDLSARSQSRQRAASNGVAKTSTKAIQTAEVPIQRTFGSRSLSPILGDAGRRTTTVQLSRMALAEAPCHLKA